MNPYDFEVIDMPDLEDGMGNTCTQRRHEPKSFAMMAAVAARASATDAGATAAVDDDDEDEDDDDNKVPSVCRISSWPYFCRIFLWGFKK